MGDIDNSKMSELIRYGEMLYEKSKKLVYIYILCSTHCKITANTKIESDAEIMLKISKLKYSTAYETLRHIESLVEDRKKLNSDDLFALSMIPQMGPKEDIRNLRIECLTLWKEIVKKGLIE